MPQIDSIMYLNYFCGVSRLSQVMVINELVLLNSVHKSCSYAAEQFYSKSSAVPGCTDNLVCCSDYHLERMCLKKDMNSKNTFKRCFYCS